MTWNYEDEPPVSPRAMSTLRSGDRPNDRVEEEAVRAMHDMGIVRTARPRRQRGWLDSVYMALAASVVFVAGVSVGHFNAVNQGERDMRRVASYLATTGGELRASNGRMSYEDMRAQSILRRAGFRDRRVIEVPMMVDSMVAMAPGAMREVVGSAVAAELAHESERLSATHSAGHASFEVAADQAERRAQPISNWIVGDVLVEARVEHAEIDRSPTNGEIRMITLRPSSGVVVIRDRASTRIIKRAPDKR